MKNKALTRKMVALLVSVVMFFTSIPLNTFAASPEFAGGDGTKDNPYLVSTKEHLDNVRKYTDSHYKMISDIKFSEEDFKEGGAFFNSGYGWVPIGADRSFGFRGTFDGNGHSIYNLKILKARPAKEYSGGRDDIGLFGYNEGTIKNLSVVDASYKHESGNIKYVGMGGIVGFNNGGNIENCDFVDGIIVNKICQHVGGIAGRNSGTIVGCVNSGSLFNSPTMAQITLGGIAGISDNDIVNCANTGLVYSSHAFSGEVGGIVGESAEVWIANSRTRNVKYCFNSGDIILKCSYFVGAGGIMGRAGGRGVVTDCYNAGRVEGVAYGATHTDYNNHYVGGIMGNSGTINRAYSLDDIFSNKVSCSENAKFSTGYISGWGSTGKSYYTGDKYDAKGSSKTGEAIKLTKEEMKKSSSFANFDFVNVWQMGDEKYPYPQLRSNPHIPKNIFKPVVETVRDDYVKLREYPGYEYSKDGVKWQASTVFGNLDKYSEYRFYQRRAKTEVDGAMEASECAYVAPRAIRDNTENSSSVVSTIKLSNDNNLKSLSVTNTKIYPAFSANVTEYSANVSNDISRLVISAKASDSKAKVTISNPILAADKTTKVTVTVKAENGSKKKYTISVYRNGANANSNNLLREIKIDGFDINPQFIPDTTEYKLTVPYETDKIKVSGLASDEKATVKIVGGEKLAVGKENIVKLICKAENGNEKEYTIKVIRSANKQSNDNNENISSDTSSLLSTNDDTNDDSSSISSKPQNDKKTVGVWLIVGVFIVAMVAGATVTILVVKRKK